MRQGVFDTQQRYGVISRALHWGMAWALAWQFVTVLVRLAFNDSALDEFMWSTHKPTGVLLMALVLLRALWSLCNIGRRPPRLSLMAWLGHLAMYAVMLLVPALALLRQYGSGDAFSAFGLSLMAGFEGDEVAWMTAPANLFHGWLGWALLALIVGHIVMAFLHRRRPEDEDVLARMWGEKRA